MKLFTPSVARARGSVTLFSLSWFIGFMVLSMPTVGEAGGELTYYFDSRSYNTLNVLTSVSDLPGNVNIWGFTDFHGVQKDAGERFDLTRYFMEYRLRRGIDPNWIAGLNGVGVEVEYNEGSGSDNTMLRFGVNYKHGLQFAGLEGGWLQWRLFPYETDESGQQFSVVHFLPLAPKVSVAGFADLNINKGTSHRWVVESQLTYRIHKAIGLVLEVRYNGFEDANPILDGIGIAGGLSAPL